MHPSRISIAVLLALVGGALAGLLVLEHYGIGSAAAAVDQLCGIGEDSGCEQVSSSRYSAIGNLSVAGLGLFFYGSMLFLLSLGLVAPGGIREGAASLASGFFGLAIVADAALLGIQAFAIGAYCKLCIGTYAVNLGAFAALFPAFRRLSAVNEGFAGEGGRRALVVWALGSIVLFSSVGALERALASTEQGPSMSLLGELPEGSRAEVQLERARQEIQELKETLDDPAKYQAYQERMMLQSFEQEPVRELALEGVPFKGPEEAPIRVVEYSDFLCPFCKNLAGALSNYLPESGGRVKIYFKNFPLDQDCNPGVSRTIHEGACELALGAICSEEQGKFWEYHDRIFASPPANATATQVTDIASSLGLDGGAFGACMASTAAKDALAEQIAEANRLEVSATPTVYINGKKLQQLGGFMKAIESESQRLGLDP